MVTAGSSGSTPQQEVCLIQLGDELRRELRHLAGAHSFKAQRGMSYMIDRPHAGVVPPVANRAGCVTDELAHLATLLMHSGKMHP